MLALLSITEAQNGGYTCNQSRRIPGTSEWTAGWRTDGWFKADQVDGPWSATCVFRYTDIKDPNRFKARIKIHQNFPSVTF